MHMTVSTLSILFFRAWSIQARFWLEWAYSDLINSVIPTGGDHRKRDDLRSGGTCCFVARECVETKSEWTARKRERAARRLLSSGRTAPLKPTSDLNGPRPGEAKAAEYTAMVEHFGGRAFAGAGLPTSGFILPLKFGSQAHAA